MKGFELVKRQDRWDLYGEDGSKIASSAPNPFKRLSIKNCQEIENGYDLDELASERLSTRFDENSGYHKFVFVEAYKEGFQKALEILGDKKFSKNKLLVDFVYFLNDRHFNKYMVDTDEVDLYLESLQQTEWDVEIVMETCQVMVQYGDMEFQDFQKLDADGCLILKRL